MSVLCRPMPGRLSELAPEAKAILQSAFGKEGSELVKAKAYSKDQLVI